MQDSPLSQNSQASQNSVEARNTTHAFAQAKSSNWSIEKSSQIYGINNWGNGYFRINSNGNVCVSPQGDKGPNVDLFELTQELQDRGIRIPIMIRFPDIIKSRVELLNG